MVRDGYRNRLKFFFENSFILKVMIEKLKMTQYLCVPNDLKFSHVGKGKTKSVINFSKF